MRSFFADSMPKSKSWFNGTRAEVYLFGKKGLIGQQGIVNFLSDIILDEVNFVVNREQPYIKVTINLLAKVREQYATDEATFEKEAVDFTYNCFNSDQLLNLMYKKIKKGV